MSTDPGNPSGIQNQNPSGIPQCGNALRDNDYRGSGILPADILQDFGFGAEVQGAHGIVNNDDFMTPAEDPGQLYPLLLTSRKSCGVGFCFFFKPYCIKIL